MSRSHLLLAAVLSASVLLTAGCVSTGATGAETAAGREHMRCMADGKGGPAEPTSAEQTAKQGCKMMDRKTESAEPQTAHDHSDTSIPSASPEQRPQ